MKNINTINKRVQIIISESQKQFLGETAANQGLSISALVRNLVDDYKRELLEKKLVQEARSLYEVYDHDDELTAFTSLDGEDFA